MIKTKYRYHGDFDRITRKLYANYRYKCIKRNRDFTLTLKEFTEIIMRRCFYCDDAPNNISQGVLYNGIDRIDSSLGYIKNNIVTCCNTCNRIKSDIFTFEDMLTLSNALKNVMKRIKNARSNCID